MDRPLHAKGVAFMDVPIGKIALAGPCINNFPALLLNRAEFHEWPCRHETDFFGKFAHRRFGQVLAWSWFPFRNRPMPFIFGSKERPAWMGDQHFQSAILPAVNKD